MNCEDSTEVQVRAQTSRLEYRHLYRAQLVCSIQTLSSGSLMRATCASEAAEGPS